MKCESCGQQEGVVAFYVVGAGGCMLCKECAALKRAFTGVGKLAANSYRLDGIRCSVCGNQTDFVAEMGVGSESVSVTVCSKCRKEGKGGF
jgi:hypothetical protein